MTESSIRCYSILSLLPIPADGADSALYDLKHLELLPDIASRLLQDTEKAEQIIRNGYEKVLQNLTWSNCADWILTAIQEI